MDTWQEYFISQPMVQKQVVVKDFENVQDKDESTTFSQHLTLILPQHYSISSNMRVECGGSIGNDP